MIEITKIENDFINKVTVATVNVYEVTMGIQRLRDTFVISLDGVYDITDPSLADLIYTRLSAIGYSVIVKTDSPANVTPVETATALDASLQQVVDTVESQIVADSATPAPTV